jgi:hypothetical protein
MGVFFRPRRPLMRLAAGATTAAVAYNAGKRRSEQNQVNEQAEAAYAATRYQQPAAPPPVASAAPDPVSELERLAKLLGSGALTDAEFAAAKSRLLAG